MVRNYLLWEGICGIIGKIKRRKACGLRLMYEYEEVVISL